jgi:TPR repeat protein
MKKYIPFIVICLGSVSILAQSFIFNTDADRQRRQDAADAAARDQERIADPWRVINGHTNCIWKDVRSISQMAATPAYKAKNSLSDKWYAFGGQIIAVRENGIVLNGWTTFPKSKSPTLFFVANYPYTVVEGDNVTTSAAFFEPSHPTTKYQDGFTSKTIYSLDYGKVWSAPVPKPKVLTAEEISTAKAIAEKRAVENAAKALAWNRAQAEKGDAYGQFRMGERYRDGEGVARDPQQARAWFAKSAAQGNIEARLALQKLNDTLTTAK